MKFYNYDHCPFCQRVKLFLGYKNIQYENIILPYSDKKTPHELCNSETLPIMDFSNGKVMNESINIIREIEHISPYPIGFIGPVEGFVQWSSTILVSIPKYFDILLPVYYDHYKEFSNNQLSSEYFKNQKEKKRNKSFEELKIESPKIFTENILPVLEEIIYKVEDEYFLMGPTFSVADCILAADLSGLRLVKNINLPKQIIKYIERVEERCNIKLI
jgi:glutaredoxin 2